MLRLLSRRLLFNYIGLLNTGRYVVKNKFNHLAIFQNCLLNQSEQINIQKRFKKKKKKEVAVKDEQEDSDEEIEAFKEDYDFFNEPSETHGKELEKVIDVPNIRLDFVLKSALSTSRKSIEEAFYNMKIRLNGEKVTKKNQEISEKDEIDLILGRNKNNIELLDVKRIIVLYISETKSIQGRSKVKVKVFHSLTIENYNDPYESMLTREEEAERSSN